MPKETNQNSEWLSSGETRKKLRALAQRAVWPTGSELVGRSGDGFVFAAAIERFNEKGRGIVSLSSVAFFLGIVAVSLYLAMVLIGRRHWAGGRWHC